MLGNAEQACEGEGVGDWWKLGEERERGQQRKLPYVAVCNKPELSQALEFLALVPLLFPLVMATLFQVCDGSASR